MQFLVFLRYLIHLGSVFSNFVLIVTGFIQSIIFFLTCYFFVKKAAFYLDDSKKIRKMLLYVMIAVLVVFLGMMVFQFFDSKVQDVVYW